MRTALAGCSCIRLSRQWHRIQLLQRSLQRSPTAAIVLALRARRRPLSTAGSRMAIGAIVLAALAIGQMVVYSIVSAVS